MAVLIAAVMLAIAVPAVLGGFVAERGRGAVTRSGRPPVVSVMPILFSVVMSGALVGGALGRDASRPPPQSEAAPELSQAALGSAPVYPGPSNGAPLPRLNLPITYNYGPGPRHPVPPSAPAPSPALGAGAVPDQSGPVPSTVPFPVPAPVSGCASGVGSASRGPIAIGPCLRPSVPAVG
jgi:hypothetical protein